MSGTRPSTPVPPGQKPWWPVFAVGALAVVGWLKPSANQRSSADRDRPGGKGDGKEGPASAGAASEGRGREADSPTEIPLTGWKDIAWRVYKGIEEDRLLAVAAGVTFYALLAIFPALAALVSLYGLIADPASISKQLDMLNGILPEGAVGIIADQVKRLAAAPHGSLSFALIASLAISLWSANAGMKAVFDALNVAYREKEERGFIKLNLLSLAFTLAAIILLIVALGCVVVLPILFNFIGMGGFAKTALAIVRWPLLMAVVVGALCVLYRYGPSRAAARWRWIFWAAVVAAVLWVIGSMLFSFYVSKFGSYNATYGSLGSAVGFMTWMWISSIIVLLGAELSGEMEHQTRKDTTTGAPKPMGSRGATMADEVGASSN
jgi:membrane protein